MICNHYDQLKMIPNKKIICNKTFDKNEIRKLIDWFLTNYGTIRTSKLLDKLKSIGFKYTTLAGISIGMEDLSVPATRNNLFQNTEKELKRAENLLKQGETTLIENGDKIIKSWNITNEILKKDLISNFREKDLLNPVYIMTFSGARGNLSQIRQLIGMRGLMSDSQGEIINLPIKSNLKEGLKVTEYFISCYGARKGLVDTALKTANSGYLTRRLIYVTQNLIIEQSNCGSRKGFNLKIKQEKKALNNLKDKIIGKVLCKEVKDTENNQIIACSGQDICKYLANKIINSRNINKIQLRSPLLCKLNKGICQLCYGWNLGNGRMVELGESIGILAAQSIGEPGTQLTMRTFHTGGVFSSEVEETVTAPHNGILNYKTEKGGKIIKTKYGEKAFLTEEEKIIRISKNKTNTYLVKVPKNSIIFVKPKTQVFFKQIIAEIENNNKTERYKLNNPIETKEITTEISGEIYFDKITTKNKRIGSKDKEKGLIWILSGNILTDNIIINNIKTKEYDKKDKINLKNYQDEKRFSKQKTINKKIVKLSRKILNLIQDFDTNQKILKEEKCYKITKKINTNKKILINKQEKEKYLKIKTKDIKVGQFLLNGKNIERRKQNLHNAQIIQKKQNEILIRKANTYVSYRNSKINIKNNDVIKKGKVIFQSLYKKKKTEDIVQGLPKIEELLEAKKNFNLEIIKNSPNQILKRIFDQISIKNNNKKAVRKSIKKIQKILVQKIQAVYEKQGVTIADKHMEIIVKQMTSKVMIKKSGDSKILTGETIEINRIEKINQTIKNKAIYEPLIIGISKLSLSNQSFISEASFQETTRILARSAIEGRIDWLYGLKENIILGNLIPIGTGYKKI